MDDIPIIPSAYHINAPSTIYNLEFKNTNYNINVNKTYDLIYDQSVFIFLLVTNEFIVLIYFL